MRDFEVRLSQEDQAQLLRDTRQFPAALRKATRSRLREVAEPAKRDVQQHILDGPSHQSTHVLRRGLAAGTKVSIRAGAKVAGVQITTTGAKLPPGKRAMVRAYDKRSFRHRVFGENVWFTQEGRPYFGSVLTPHARQMHAGMEHALIDAAKSFRTGQVNR